MKAVIEFLNNLEQEKIIKGYALAGGTALLFYTEPVTTYDVDIFISYPVGPKGLIDLRPLYRAAEEKGYKAKDEHIMIGKIPIQLFPVDSGLELESVEEALEKEYEGSKIKVLSPEYLIANMLNTNRSKDKERILKMLDDEVAIDNNKLDRILIKYNLKNKWEKIIDKTK